MAVGRTLAHVEDGAARHVVIDDAVRESVELVALADELAANRFDLRRSHPVRQRLLLNADQLRAQASRKRN